MDKKTEPKNLTNTLLLKLCIRYDPDAEDSVIWAINELEAHMDTYSIASFMVERSTGQRQCEIMLGRNDNPEWHGTQAKYCLSLIVGDDWVLDNFWFDDDISQETYDAFIAEIENASNGQTSERRKSDERGNL